MRLLPSPRSVFRTVVVGIAALSSVLATDAFARGVIDKSDYGKVGVIRTNHKTGVIVGFALVTTQTRFAVPANAATKYEPRSSAAAVQGFAKGEFAVAVLQNKVAALVQYDTTPFTAGSFEAANGTIIHVGKGGVFTVRTPNGTAKLFTTAQTLYYVNGQPQSAYALKVPMTVKAIGNLAKPSVWNAVTIDRQDSSGGGGSNPPN